MLPAIESRLSRNRRWPVFSLGATFDGPEPVHQPVDLDQELLLLLLGPGDLLRGLEKPCRRWPLG
jgi:hypothetical protein